MATAYEHDLVKRGDGEQTHDHDDAERMNRQEPRIREDGCGRRGEGVTRDGAIANGNARRARKREAQHHQRGDEPGHVVRDVQRSGPRAGGRRRNRQAEAHER